MLVDSLIITDVFGVDFAAKIVESMHVLLPYVDEEQALSLGVPHGAFGV